MCQGFDMRRIVAGMLALSVVALPSCVSDRPERSTESTVAIDLAAPGIAIDARLFGTNLPAWVGPDRLADEDLRQQVIDLGATVIRMPGGSWSNHYDWRACELGEEDGCFWTWAARPTDFVDFLQATGAQGMWTVSFNGTAQEAAAAVAFFNGQLGDATPIGVDRRGRDWGVIGDWAQLRAAGGNPEPQRIELWEVGNEIFGAEPDASGNCADFGWENVWTCDGAEYVRGDDSHDGLVDFLAAMRAVDPAIEIGAVGVHDPSSWTDFGHDVLDSPEPFDFYVVHDYGFDHSPSGEEAVASPARKWGEFLDPLDDALEARQMADLPVAITEYNLVSFEDADTDQMMTRAANALFLADTIGQMAERGVAMANQWNVVNGRAWNGTDYGMIDADTGVLAPQYYGLQMWTSMTGRLLPVEHGFDPIEQASAYAAVDDGGVVRVMIINKSDDPLDVELDVAGASGALTWTVRAVVADDLEATTLDVHDGRTLSSAGPTVEEAVAAYSITVLEGTPSSATG